MKTKSILVCAAFFALACHPALFAADAGGAKEELSALVNKIQAKLSAGARTEADLEAELKEFDVLLAKHQGEKSEDVSQILALEASVYLEILHNAEKTLAIVQQIKADFPDSAIGHDADNIIASLQKQVAAEQIQKSLTVGSVFPEFSEKDTGGNPLSVANYKGKVVLIDFWATWCGPCVAELPNVVKTYQQNHAKGFEVIGISLDREGDGDKLAQFTKEHDMPWPQFFDGQYWSNKLAVKFGVDSIPCTFLLDGTGRIIGRDLRGEDLASAVTQALAAK
jgi:peroxiredoxin